jgi:hypothetical protein
MRHGGLAAVSAVIAAGLLTSGCTSHSYTCSGNACHVTVQGKQTLKDVGSWNVQIINIESNSLTLAVDGARATVPVGRSIQVGQAKVTVTGIEDGKARFDIEG